MRDTKKPFFVFYLKIPLALRQFLLKVAGVFVFSFLATGLLLGMTQDDPGKAGFRGDYGRQKVVGVLETRPYPLLRVIQGSKNIEVGHTLMLTGVAKSGITKRAEPLSGKIVQVEGILIKRGELDMMQIRGGKRGIDQSNQTSGSANIAPPKELGEWKIAGEICDGKCLAGAMNPGRGIAHKACANLCLLGDIPPVFVSTQKVHGTQYFLMANENGNKINEDTYNYVGQFVEVQGELEQRGDLIIIKTKNIKNIK